MFDPTLQREPLTPQERWIGGSFLLVLLGLFTAEIFTNYEPAKLSALLVVLFWIPLLALHEAGHAVFGHLLGWHVGLVVIGFGRLVYSFQIGTAVVEIRWIPIEGFAWSVPRDLRLARLKNAIIYFAGPGVELLLALGTLIVLGPEILFTRSQNHAIIAWQSLALASAVHVVINLIPHVVRTPHGDVANDGLGIIRSFLLPASYYAALIGRSPWEQRNEPSWTED